MTEQKITDEQLEKEIQKDKTAKEIAYQYGFGYPSATLSERADKLGYERNRMAKIRQDGGVNIYMKQSVIEDMLELSEKELLERNGDQHFAYRLLTVQDDGCLVLKPEDSVWRQTTGDGE